MHKTKAAIAGIIALLAAAGAAAQTFPSVPANSVIGRLGVGTGPSQAIPFNTLRSQMGIAAQPEVYASTYGVTCDGTTDDTAAAQLAITTAAGRPVVFPAGTCKISSTLVYTTSGSTFFSQGLQIRGQGREKTIFDSRVANGYLFSADANQNGRFHSGAVFQDFKITTLAVSPPVASSGILIHRAANTLIQNVQISNISGSGIVGTASAGDPDASFIVVLDRVRIDVVAGWCVNLAAPSGGYFGSNVRVVNSSFNTCGTAGVAVPPTSGGFQIKNLIAQIVNSAFTINNNVDLYVQGADTSMQITVDGVDFENNVSTVLPHVYVDGGLRGFFMYNSECLNNDSYISQGCVWFNSAAAPIGDVTIDKVEVRATSANNTYTAFKQTGGNTLSHTIRVRDIYWQTFDASGQTRFSGIQFDLPQGQAKFSVTGLGTAHVIPIGHGATIPLKMKATGEWVPFQVPNAGVTAAGLTGLSNNTQYYFYLTNTAATNFPLVGGLEITAAVPTLDADSGYYVKTGDATRTYVGTATTNGSGQITTNNTDISFYPAGNSVGSMSDLGTGVATALKTNVGSAGAFTVYGGVGNFTTVAATATTDTTSGTTGALTVAGGVGVAGRAWIGNGSTAGAGRLNLDGPNSSNEGSAVLFRRNGTGLFAFGNASAILGGGSNDFVVYGYTTGAGTTSALSVSDANGGVFVGSHFGTTAPTTKTASYSVGLTDNTLIFNCAGSCTLTLPSAATYSGRVLRVRTIAAQTVVSASSNVVPLAGGAAGTAILAATAGKYATLQSDGTNWQIIEAN
jgi:hypothetical protein